MMLLASLNPVKASLPECVTKEHWGLPIQWGLVQTLDQLVQ